MSSASSPLISAPGVTALATVVATAVRVEVGATRLPVRLTACIAEGKGGVLLAHPVTLRGPRPRDFTSINRVSNACATST